LTFVALIAAAKTATALRCFAVKSAYRANNFVTASGSLARKAINPACSSSLKGLSARRANTGVSTTVP
jgi:hypothetical protein